MTVRPIPGFSLYGRGRVKIPGLGVKFFYRTIFSVWVARRENVAGVQKNAALGATTAKFPYDVQKSGLGLGVHDLYP